jgi:undecaprenyl-diphosphatase
MRSSTVGAEPTPQQTSADLRKAVLDRVRKSAFPPFQAVALGLLQGPTELLPVSSSAHTTLLPWLAGWSYSELDPELRKSFEVALHAGAGAALAIDMRGELLEEALSVNPRRAATIACSLAPAAIAGYALRPFIERRLGGPRSIAAGLIAGAAAMAIADARHARGNRRRKDVGPRDGLALGLAQAVALMPGVSRNGAALTAALARGFARRDAQALSWHAALPVILGASALEGARLARCGAPEGARGALAGGGGAAFVSTLASAHLLRRGPPGRSLMPFALYRGLLALVVVRRLRRAHNTGG